VLHIVGGTALAGTERHVLALAADLRMLGYQAEIACPQDATELRAAAEAAAVPVRSVLGLVGRDVPNVVHVHDGRSALVGSGVALVAGAALVRTQHFVKPASAERTGWRGQLSVGLHRVLNRRLDGYICVSAAAAEAAYARRDVARVPTVVIPPGVGIPSSGQVDAASQARSAAIPQVVLSAGRLEPERRFDVLLDAIPNVLGTVPNCEFVIAGAGSAETDLRARARALGVEEHVKWTGWLSDLAPVMARACIYVNTWPSEGFGMATAEAMGFGLAVIAANSGASPELVEDHVTGRLVEPVDPADLGAALIELLSDRGRVAAMGAAGRERALTRYSVRATSEATLAFYAQLPRVSLEL
jgi:glycosyltransferase involved in cell wall biosynthesis